MADRRPGPGDHGRPHRARRRPRSAAQQHYRDRDSGYSKQQSTRPQTLGYGLVDSPAGQAAWILEKFWAWTDCDGHPENVAHPRRAARQRDALLAHRNRRVVGAPVLGELQHAAALASRQSRPASRIFPKEIIRPSRRWAEKRYTDIRHWNELDRGGHFAAFEATRPLRRRGPRLLPTAQVGRSSQPRRIGATIGTTLSTERRWLSLTGRAAPERHVRARLGHVR